MCKAKQLGLHVANNQDGLLFFSYCFRVFLSLVSSLIDKRMFKDSTQREEFTFEKNKNSNVPIRKIKNTAQQSKMAMLDGNEIDLRIENKNKKQKAKNKNKKKTCKRNKMK